MATATASLTVEERLARRAAVGEEQPYRGGNQDDGHDGANSQVVHVEKAECRRHGARGAEVQEQDADDGDNHAADDRPDDVLVHSHNLTGKRRRAGPRDRRRSPWARR